MVNRMFSAEKKRNRGQEMPRSLVAFLPRCRRIYFYCAMFQSFHVSIFLLSFYYIPCFRFIKMYSCLSTCVCLVDIYFDRFMLWSMYVSVYLCAFQSLYHYIIQSSFPQFMLQLLVYHFSIILWICLSLYVNHSVFLSFVLSFYRSIFHPCIHLSIFDCSRQSF